MNIMSNPNLEFAAQEMADATANPPFLYELGPEGAARYSTTSRLPPLTSSRSKRAHSTASPLRAGADELTGLPPALVIVDENDVLRDEGEAYARRPVQAGAPTTSIRYKAVIHDLMMLSPVCVTNGANAAIEQAIRTLRTAFAN
ncbi:alpha/beta hydrolase fold domain-containing protein (plasmid) [Streptomyces tendae]|uniref:Alpha/beta hydrolase fold domain-containing protein n=1 Tax=Streptomyces tendae TaxID=1932 RepID=A0ABX6A0F2_STRTE|nr:alpha/beta hydrolase fold domain-containing protein [Streptomyces tendae]